MGKRQNSRRGAAMIEFAFWVVIMTVSLSAIVDFSWYMARSEIIMRAARDGSRSGAVNSGNDAAVIAAAEARANQVLTSLGEGGCSVDATVSTNALTARVITTQVACPFVPLMGIIPKLSMTPGGPVGILPAQIGYSFAMYSEFQQAGT